ncbi:hypothetical protein [Pseudoalteromonas sp. MMG022]|uniref:hypothetical protein n=1 Tax=Pseudoalteromonas sp. MMG022 TaxID=2909978 RepID=UPI001F464E00|nr:hypothetical protein [Pseudoalteromonas sp. MMG022]MCF6435215.1 hypothetical protein [Pseudoalteromonas sp. MMG022]
MSEELTNAVTALQNVTNKHEQLNAQYQGTHDALAGNTQAMTDWQTQSGTVELTDQNGNKHTTPTLKSLVAQAQSVNPHPDVMSKAQFEALCQMRKQQYAGSGFVEWGKHNSGHPNINEGLWQYVAAGAENSLTLGDIEQNTYTGTSRSFNPIVVIDGVQHVVAYVGRPNTQNRPTFPPAPDGTKTYDSATGTVTQHSNAEVAFASETDTNKVITSRKDLVFLESWHEKIADKDVVFPLGNVQYGVSSYEGITLLNNLVAQGYSAFGEWDQNTKGYGVKWSTLSDEHKAVFLGEPEHNIYFDPKAKAYIQVRYRIRVIEGHGDNWPDAVSASKGISSMVYNQNTPVKPRAKLETSDDFGDFSEGYFLQKNHSYNQSNTEVGEFIGGTSQGLLTYLAHEGSVFAIPIALVQRLNQGAYHPTYNPMGVCGFATTSNPDSQLHCTQWYQNVVTQPTSTVDCFDVDISRVPFGGENWGSIQFGWSGRPDQYKYHDAIYAGQVEDLRLNANKLDVNQLREDMMRKSVSGELRGKEKLLFTKFKTLHQGYLAGSNTANAIFKDSSGVSLNFYDNGFPMYTPVMVWQPSTNTVLYGQISSSNSHIMLTGSPSNLGKSGHIIPTTLGMNMSDVCYFAEVWALSSEFDSLPWVDIIGSPENIVAKFPDGVVGQWVPVTPDGSGARFNLNRKVMSAETDLAVYWDGTSWLTSTNAVNLDLVQNSVAHPALFATNNVVLYFYESGAGFTTAANNSGIVGEQGSVWYGSSYQTYFGNRLQPSLTGKVATSNKSGPDTNAFGYMNLARYVLNESNLPRDPSISSIYASWMSPVLNMSVPTNNSSAVKATYSVIEKNGLLYLQFHGAELKHNGTDWGDDQTIPIISRENTKTDLNGNTVKVFCHHTQLPIGIAYNH